MTRRKASTDGHEVVVRVRAVQQQLARQDQHGTTGAYQGCVRQRTPGCGGGTPRTRRPRRGSVRRCAASSPRRSHPPGSGSFPTRHRVGRARAPRCRAAASPPSPRAPPGRGIRGSRARLPAVRPRMSRLAARISVVFVMPPASSVPATRHPCVVTRLWWHRLGTYPSLWTMALPTRGSLSGWRATGVGEPGGSAWACGLPDADNHARGARCLSGPEALRGRERGSGRSCAPSGRAGTVSGGDSRSSRSWTTPPRTGRTCPNRTGARTPTGGTAWPSTGTRWATRVCPSHVASFGSPVVSTARRPHARVGKWRRCQRGRLRSSLHRVRRRRRRRGESRGVPSTGPGGLFDAGRHGPRRPGGAGACGGAGRSRLVRPLPVVLRLRSCCPARSTPSGCSTSPVTC